MTSMNSTATTFDRVYRIYQSMPGFTRVYYDENEGDNENSETHKLII
jgi:hypothetical protein